MIRPDKRAQLQLAVRRCLINNHGQLPRATATALAGAFEVSTRSVYREAATMLRAHGTPTGADLDADPTNPATQAGGGEVTADLLGPPTPWWESEQARQRVLNTLGGEPTVAAAWRTLTSDGVVTVTYPAFTRQLKDHLPPAVHAGLTAHGRKKGRDGWIAASLYCTEVTEGRNTCWQADVQYLPLKVRAENGTEVATVYMITFLDEATRRVMAFSLTLDRPTGADVVATLAAGVAGTTDALGNFFGGLPTAIRWDNGGEFLNEAVTEACVQLGIVPVPSPPYSGWRKGKIERFHRTSQDQFFATLKGYTHGPKTFTGRRPWQGGDGDLLFFSSVVLLTQEWVAKYNDENEHKGIGCTPRAAWLGDTTQIRVAPAPALHPLMLAVRRRRKVAKDGISYKKVKYLAPELRRWRGRKVEIRVLPQDVDRIFVFDPDTGGHICQALPAARLTVTQRRELLRQRDADYRVVRAAIEAGTQARARDAVYDAVLAEEDQRNRGDAGRDHVGDGTGGEAAAPDEPSDAIGFDDTELTGDVSAFLDLMDEPEEEEE